MAFALKFPMQGSTYLALLEELNKSIESHRHHTIKIHTINFLIGGTIEGFIRGSTVHSRVYFIVINPSNLSYIPSYKVKT